jgi:hypothetical protein
MRGNRVGEPCRPTAAAAISKNISPFTLAMLTDYSKKSDHKLMRDLPQFGLKTNIAFLGKQDFDKPE